MSSLGIASITVAPNVPILLLGRFITGIATGSTCLCLPIYLGEISHPDIRGVTGSLATACYCIGFSISQVLGALTTWRIATGIMIATAVASFVSILFCPESPVWLIRNDRDEEARAALIRFGFSNFALFFVLINNYVFPYFLDFGNKLI